MLKRTVYTKTISEAKIERKAHLFDAKGQKLGRLASVVAAKLIGKHKVNYAPNLDMGDYVIIVNSDKLDINARKINSKQYTRYSGYQSGLKTVSMASMWPKESSKIINLAVKGMLPDNKLKKARLSRLYVFRHENYSLSPKIQKLIIKKDA